MKGINLQGQSEKFLKEYYERQGEEANIQLLLYTSRRFDFYTRGDIIRKALVEFLLDKLLSSGKSTSFLDVGCGEGWYVDYAAKHTTYAVGIDISKPKIRRDYGKKRGHYLIADAEYLPFKQGSFFLVLCSETLEHLLQPRLCVEELFRVSKNHVTLTVPIKIVTYWDRIICKIRTAKMRRSNQSFEEHLNVPELKTLVEWVSSGQWQITDCFLIGSRWFEKFDPVKQKRIVLDFPLRDTIKRLTQSRLSALLEKPQFIVLMLQSRN